MRNYLKLCRLAYRKNAANAAILQISEEIKDLALARKLLEDEKRMVEGDTVWNSSREKLERKLSQLNRDIALTIARQDVASEEQAKCRETWNSAVATFTNVHNYLKQNPNEIPEGMPNEL
jgi:lipid II:glycine glycyltransferase (peptidoglycan interpeptide bridge formation enzyme)